MLATLIAAAVMAAAAPAPPGPVPDPVTVLAPDFDPPRFIERPGPAAFAAAYPRAAGQTGMGGRAVLHCPILANGRLDKCQVASESPAGVGFGEAALSLSRSIRLDPASPATLRGVIDLPINFAASNDGSQLIGVGPWVAAPSFADVAGAYPDIGGGVAGVVVLRCTLARDGALKACRVIYARPSDRDFGPAALKLSRLFRMRIDPAQLKTYLPMSADVLMRLAAPFSDEAKQKRIADPQWLTGPDLSPQAAIFPPKAAAKGVTRGLGYADCTVAADGSLQACQPFAGEPSGLGFSEAAAKAAGSMRMSPWTDAGGPVDGARVRIPIALSQTGK